MIPTIASPRPILQIVVLAAGFSSRLGTPKALARIRGWSLLDRTLGVLSSFATSSKIIVVVPPRSRSYRIGRYANRAAFVSNPHRASGLATSVRCAVATGRHSAAILLLPVDLVGLRHRDVAKLIWRWRGARRKIVARRVGTRAGSPLILPRWLYPHALGVTGDLGLRDLVRGLPASRVVLVSLPSAEQDVDTVADLHRARRGRPAQPRF